MVSHADTEHPRALRRGFLTAPGPLLMLGDVLATLVAFAAATAITMSALVWLGFRIPVDIDELVLRRLGHFVLFVLLMIGWFTHLGHYKRGLPFWTETKQVLVAATVLSLIDGFSQYLSQELYSRPWLMLSWAFAAFAVIAGRMAVKDTLHRLGVWDLPTIVVGEGATADAAVAALNSERLLGYRVVARKRLEEVQSQRGAGRFDTPFPFVVIAADAPDLPRVDRLVADLHRRGIAFAIVPPLSGISVLNLQARGFFSHDAVLLTAPNNLARLHARVLKRSFDLVVASVLLVLLAPLFAVLAILISRDGGPVFYAQARIGRGGRPIRCLKFRTMVVDADRVLTELLANDPQAREEWDRDWKLRDDPRVTPVGAFLRRTSLDELPQLLNVVRGEMSLVGPRPIVAAEVEKFGDDIVYYLEVDPGMTGLWQVSGRNGLDYRRRVQLNSWYVRNWSLWHDITILIRTVRVVLARDGAY